MPTRSPLPVSGLNRATLEMWTGMVLSMMPPATPAIGLPRLCFLTTLTPSTFTRSEPTRSSTTPRRPLSRPASTMTSSPLRIFCMTCPLQHFRSQGHDLHELFCTQFARDRAEDTCANGFQLGIEQYRGIATKLDERTVLATNTFGGTHHHRVVDFAFFDASARSRFLDGDLDDVTDCGITALGAAQHLDAHYRPCTGVIGHAQRGLHLNHEQSCSISTA